MRRARSERQEAATLACARMILADVPLWFLRAFAVSFGLIWGSFLNVVIYRVPRGMSVSHPPSHCPGCGKPVKPYDNVPVLSYVILRGKARCCKTPMSPRYPIVELIGGALSLAIVEVVLRQMPQDTSIARAAAVYITDLAACLALAAAAFIDAEHMFLPDGITLGGTVLGVATASLRSMSYVDAILGVAFGFVLVWLPFVFLYTKVRGRAGMGMGDAKLMMMTGAFFGWPGALFVLFGGALQGTIGAIVIYVLRGKIEEPAAVVADREELKRLAAEGDDEAKVILADDPLANAPEDGLGKARMPFGPFLILAFLEFLFAGSWFFRSYMSVLGF
jgi:leader peptidase (prepilin peptidase) / N-methyltransferase